MSCLTGVFVHVCLCINKRKLLLRNHDYQYIFGQEGNSGEVSCPSEDRFKSFHRLDKLVFAERTGGYA